MFHRPPRPEDNVHIICGKGIKVLFENKSNGPHSKKLGHPVSLSLFFFLSLSYSLVQADPLEHRGSLCSLICLGF